MNQSELNEQTKFSSSTNPDFSSIKENKSSYQSISQLRECLLDLISTQSDIATAKAERLSNLQEDVGLKLEDINYEIYQLANDSEIFDLIECASLKLKDTFLLAENCMMKINKINEILDGRLQPKATSENQSSDSSQETLKP
jgi:hypothetical protein